MEFMDFDFGNDWIQLKHTYHEFSRVIRLRE